MREICSGQTTIKPISTWLTTGKSVWEWYFRPTQTTDTTPHKSSGRRRCRRRSKNLRVWLDRLKGGRTATVVRGFVGSQQALAELGKELKTRCGVGGTAKDGEIIVQGDHRDRIVELLTRAGYRCKRAGG